MPVGTIIKIRRDAAADWTAGNPVLSEGEFGYETDTGILKVGDGTTAYNSLPALIVYGTTAGTTCQGNDSRLSNARTPTTHAATHKSAGSDVIKIDELAAGTDVTTLNATSLVHGLLPKLSGVATEFLNGSGGYTVPTVSSVVGVAYGSATVLATTTSIEVTHGLTGTPTSVIITPSVTPKGKYYWVDTIGATTFKINIDSADATDPISFSWCAKV